MRRNLSILAVAVTVLTIGFGTLSLLDNAAKATTNKSISFTNVKKIRLEGNATRVTFTGVETASVIGTRTETYGLRRAEVSERRLDDGTLVLTSRCPGFALSTNCGVNYKLNVPKNVEVSGSVNGGGATLVDIAGNVDLRSSAGDIRGTNLSGALTLRSTAGDVKVTAPSGEIDLTSTAGNVIINSATSTTVRAYSSAGDVRLEFATAPESIDANSSAGDVTVIVPASGEAYSVDLDTSAGSENVGIRTDPKSDRRLKLRSSAGDVNVKYAAPK
jgi:hypothetical protein